MSTTITAAELLGFRLCTGQCLLGLEDTCVCRCGGQWHAALAAAEIAVPLHLTLADALSGGPAGMRRTRPVYSAPAPQAHRVRTDEAARALLAVTPRLTNKQLAAAIGTSERTARRVRARLNGTATT